MTILNTFFDPCQYWFDFEAKKLRDPQSGDILHEIEFATDHKKRSDDEIFFWIDNEKFTYPDIEKSRMHSNYKHEILLQFDEEIETYETYLDHFRQPDMMDDFKNNKENY